MAADRPPQNVGSLRLPITKRQRRDRLDLWITWVEDRNHRGEAFTLPDWGRHELIVLGVAIPDPLTGASLHEALMDAQADALNTLPWPPKPDPADRWHAPCPDCGVDWRSAFRAAESVRCKGCVLGLHDEIEARRVAAG